MDRINGIDKDLEQIKELFKELESAEAYAAWAGTFDIEVISPKKVNIIYHGLQSVGAFKKACKETLFACIRSIMGGWVKIRVLKKRGYTALSAKTRKNFRAVRFFVAGLLFVCIAAASVVVLYNYVVNRQFRETFYTTSSIKVDNPIRVIQLSDLHGARYGGDNQPLLDRIAALAPDVILCTGDMVDSTTEDLDAIVSLGAALADIAPSYYIYGNNEVDSIYGFPFNEADLDAKFGFDAATRDEAALTNLADSFETKLEQAGIQVLKNEMATLTVNSTVIDVYGVLNSNPSSFWSYSGTAFGNYLYENPSHLKITAVHEPFIFQEFEADSWGDLLLCGHTHGGLVRVPVLGPLYTPEGGLFPARNSEYVYGRYDVAGAPLIVSSGLENSTILRINNQPELVIIDINKF
jgi:predicted MPP superfamily phosphohydrolase